MYNSSYIHLINYHHQSVIKYISNVIKCKFVRIQFIKTQSITTFLTIVQVIVSQVRNKTNVRT